MAVSGKSHFFERRRAGVLLHPTSLPSRFPEGGDLGPDAHRFLAFLHASGFSVWQMLPTCPPHDDGSPYQALSVHAGNPCLISLDVLQQRGLLQAGDIQSEREVALAAAAKRFAQLLKSETDTALAFNCFCDDNAHWLDDFALFIALREAHQHRAWFQWAAPLRQREASALSAQRNLLAERIDAIKFEQFEFYRQWQELHTEAKALDIALFGDMPIFVALDSVDVWAHQELFDLDAEGQPRTVAGVPPDYFSPSGQRWGNPQYDWQRMQQDGFAWWLARIRSQSQYFDLLRIDHFRGFEAYWEIDAKCETAVDGRWVKAPGEALLNAIAEAFPNLPVVAENLGLITPEVEALRHKFNLPGMSVLQFAFDGSRDNPYVPHRHSQLDVVYTGTHDNDTTLGWHRQLDEVTRARVDDYLGYPREAMPRPLVRAALASVSHLAIIPMQDLLELGSEHRMNMPGTKEGNWRWRFDWQQVDDALHGRLHHYLKLYGRA
jgi:4-alpha-glucanotransferase